MSAQRATPTPARTLTVTVNRDTPVATSQLAVGVTHVGNALDASSAPAAASRARAILESTTIHQNQHIMGWGTDDPWPNPTDKEPTNWGTLDRRVRLSIESGGLPVITLAVAPWWMKGIPRDKEWAPVAYERRVRDDHLADWVTLCRRVAERYAGPPYYVRHFQVWNELKGYYNPTTNTWDTGINPGVGAEYTHGYTYMYNLVYDALKAINPRLRIGGPYPVIESWSDRRKMSNPSPVSGPYGTLDQRPLDGIREWLQHQHGADFITVAGTTTNADGKQITDLFSATQKFADVAAWVRRQTTLPLWWAEWRATDEDIGDLDLLNALMATALVQMTQSGVAVPLLWQPEGDAQGLSFPEGLWTNTRDSAGGQPTPYAATQTIFKDHFSVGTPLYQAKSSSPAVRVLASATSLLLINTANAAVTVDADGTTVTLERYAVRLV